MSLTNSFEDTGFEPDTLDNPPEQNTPFEDDYPATVGFWQQRLILAGSNGAPQTFQASLIGHLFNFNKRRVLHDDDAFKFTISGRRVLPIRHILDLDGLVLLTAGGAWVAEGDQTGVLTPTAIGLKRQGTIGASTLRPLLVDRSALVVSAQGARSSTGPGRQRRTR